MNNSVTLFLEGDLTQDGFRIRKQNYRQNCDSLPPCPELIIAYNDWRENLYEFEQYSITIDTNRSEATTNNSNSPLDDFSEMMEEENDKYEQKREEYNNSEQNLIQQFNEVIKW